MGKESSTTTQQQIATLRAVIAREAEGGSVVFTEVLYTTPPNEADGAFVFESVALRTVFDRPVMVSIMLGDLTPTYLSIAPDTCEPSQRSVSGTFTDRKSVV